MRYLIILLITTSSYLAAEPTDESEDGLPGVVEIPVLEADDPPLSSITRDAAASSNNVPLFSEKLERIPSGIRMLTRPLLNWEAEEDYKVGGKDILQIVVYDEPDLSTDQVRVSLDGYLNFPLIGKVQVDNLTTSEIEEKLESLLRGRFILEPQVSVLVVGYASRKVFVLGDVKKPGTFELKGKTTLLEVISNAEGIGESAGKRIVILRKDDDSREVSIITVDRRRLFDDGDLSLNLAIYGGDTIYVPAADVIYVMGEVKKPGTFQLTESNKTVLAAINRAGGFTRIAAPKKTTIVRVIDGEERIINVNVEDIMKRGDKTKDVLLKTDDIIIVPEGLF